MSAAVAMPTDAERIVDHWRAGVLSVPPHDPPCPGMTSAGWPGVHAGMIEFLDTWGVDRDPSPRRCDPRDSNGALVNVTHMPFSSIEPGIVRFPNGLVNRGMTNPVKSIPLW